jgi:hypothetical protein
MRGGSCIVDPFYGRTSRETEFKRHGDGELNLELTRIVSLYSFRASSRNFLLSFSINLPMIQAKGEQGRTFGVPSNTSLWCFGEIPLFHPREILFGGEIHPDVIKIPGTFSIVLLQDSPRPSR